MHSTCRRPFGARRLWHFLCTCLGATVVLSLPASRGAETPARIAVEPPAVVLKGKTSRQQVAVTAVLADGSLRDVTAEARFSVEPAGVAGVSADGVVVPLDDGDARLVVEAAGRTAWAPVSVEQADRGRPVSYRHDVVALLSKAGCNTGACHGNLNGKGGFRLSLRGDDPRFDLLAHDPRRLRPPGRPRRTRVRA